MTSLSPIDQSQLPADVRSADKTDQQRYVAALQFEQMLVQQMMSQMLSDSGADDSDAIGAGGEDDDSSAASDAVTSQYAQMLPELLAHAVSQGEGLGLARQLYESMKEQQ